MHVERSASQVDFTVNVTRIKHNRLIHLLVHRSEMNVKQSELIRLITLLVGPDIDI